MKNIILILAVVFLAAGTTDAYSQSWLEKLGKKAVERAKDRSKQKVEDKVNEKVDKTVDKAFETGEEVIKGDDKNKDQPTGQTNQQGKQATPVVNPNDPKAVEMAYAKSDFVPGDVIIFEDDVVGEQLGEFPSKWDLVAGSVEVISIDGETVIQLSRNGHITPLMEDMKSYLTDEFTVEFDFWVNDQQEKTQAYYLHFTDAENNVILDYDLWDTDYRWNYLPGTGGAMREGKAEQVPYLKNAWNHFSLSFNKRAMKAYLNGVRFTTVPSMAASCRFSIEVHDHDNHFCCIRNVRIAKGAVPLYDRMMTDGKFITYGITFDVGKSTIKPESMGEINRIVKLMQDNPDLKFSVEGHTDSTGNEATNQTLSDARSKAVVDKLVEMGIAATRLTSSGKGQSNPIADNGTDEGRAKNRRVEFVKM
ncbi:OmpA family protein [Bacteroides uniformis]|uniref:OmpA family protein n=1 Tax=Bacteroides uniformis TaxID=820 RepID=UPI00233F61C6|nr:OmpA family protein [Bacteroides uniformis]MDC1809369.1 OmpA family protein [Bacteroides uniformis]